MPLVELTLPPGVHRHGTDMGSENRWRDVNLVRWRDGSMRPVGGWVERLPEASLAAPARGAHAWVNNLGDRFLALGTFEKLHIISNDTDLTDITPAGLSAGNVDAAANYGYGGGAYGAEAYGVRRVTSSGTLLPPTNWSLDNWGENLVACSDGDTGIYEWVYTSGTSAQPIANAPTATSIIVTAERFLFALAADNNPRLVRWCDREDNTVWTPTAINEAGDIELQTPGQILCAVRVRGRTLILTNIDAHVASYQGPPTVYGFERVGDACGAVSRNAAVPVNEGAMWMGCNNFLYYDGSSVTEVPCEVHDHVYADINATQYGKVFGVHNQAFGEVWWFYPSGGSGENDRYVAYNYHANHWLIGELDRTAGVSPGVWQRPLWVSAGGGVYDHELGTSHGGLVPYAESGPINIDTGEVVARATELIPDERTQGDVQAYFRTRFHPNDVERTYGPYAMSNPTSVRFTGRQLRMRVEGAAVGDWRVGTMRLDIRPGGRR